MENLRKTHLFCKGFTLIEVMVVVGIVAILAALAVPAYQDAVRKSRRSDAVDAVLNVSLAQERWRANNATYGTLANLGMTNPLVSSGGHYNITVTLPFANRATVYSILATAQGGQANDACGNLTLAFNAGVVTKTVSGSAGAANCWKQ